MVLVISFLARKVEHRQRNVEALLNEETQKKMFFINIVDRLLNVKLCTVYYPITYISNNEEEYTVKCSLVKLSQEQIFCNDRFKNE